MLTRSFYPEYTTTPLTRRKNLRSAVRVLTVNQTVAVVVQSVAAAWTLLLGVGGYAATGNATR